MYLAGILHSMVWVLFQGIAEVLPSQDVHESRESGVVLNGSIFAHCQNFEDYDRAFTIMQQQGLLAEIPCPEEIQDFSIEGEFIVYKLQLVAEDLNSHLDATGFNEATDEQELIGCFLDLARKLGSWSRTADVAPIPVRKGAAIYPRHFEKAVICLSDAGYCLRSGDRMSWLPKIAPIMKAEGIWSGDRLAVDQWRDELDDLVSIMPFELRARVVGDDGQISRLPLLHAFRYYWDPETGWLDEKRAIPIDSRHHPFSQRQMLEIFRPN